MQTPSASSSRHEFDEAVRAVELIADGGTKEGLGHVGRCLALWEALGDQATFRLNDHDAANFVRQHGATVVSTQESEAPVVVLDRIAPTERTDVRALQARGHLVVLLDDLGSGRKAADAVIDPPTAAEWPPAGKTRFAGFDHVLLRREVISQHRSKNPSGVLLAMGGSDPFGHTVALATALTRVGHEPIVALGPAYKGETPREGRLLTTHEQFLSALGGAQLVVTGYGHTVLEAAYLGVPTVAIPTRPEHVRHAEAFALHGTAIVASPETAAQVADRLAGDALGRRCMAERGPSLVDGGGAERVAQALLELV